MSRFVGFGFNSLYCMSFLMIKHYINQPKKDDEDDVV
jgi:hypothetical protein